MKLEIPYLKLLAGDIYRFFNQQDNPPADEIHVPVDLMQEDKKNKDHYYATVRYVINCAGRKVHSVRINFAIDEKGRFLTNTWKYV